MQFVDLKAQQNHIKSLIEKRINTVLDHGQYIMGPEIQELEEKLAAFTGAKHCITVSSGTDALLIAMMALGIQPGDEVITTPFSFIATAETILLLGAVPIFIDIDPDTYNIDVNLIEAAITDRTKCIIPVSLYGQCSDMTAINSIAAKHNIPVIEDAAQSFGAKHNQQKSCNQSLIGCTSFFPAKPLGCYGDGGACFTNDDALADRLRQVRSHGQEERYYHKVVGINGRMDTLQAAILLAKFEVFPEEIEQRIAAAEFYSANLCNLVKTPYIETNNKSVFGQYTIEVDLRDEFKAELQKENIPTAVHYPRPLHKQAAFADQDHQAHSLPIAESAANKVLSLPLDGYITQHNQQKVIDAIHCVHAILAKR